MVAASPPAGEKRTVTGPRSYTALAPEAVLLSRIGAPRG